MGRPAVEPLQAGPSGEGPAGAEIRGKTEQSARRALPARPLVLRSAGALNVSPFRSLDWVAVAERVLEAEAVEVPGEGQGSESQSDVRALPERRSPAELGAWRGEVKAIAVVAAGGLACGAATVAALSRARSRSGSRSRIVRRGRGDRDNIVASRSFLVDVHVLGR